MKSLRILFLILIFLVYADLKSINPDVITLREDKWAYKEDEFVRLLHWRAPFPSYGQPWPRPFYHAALSHIYRYLIGNITFSFSGETSNLVDNYEFRSELPITSKHQIKDILSMSNTEDKMVENLIDPLFHPKKLFNVPISHFNSICPGGTVERSTYLCEDWLDEAANKFYTFMKKRHQKSDFNDKIVSFNELNIHIHIEEKSSETPSLTMDESYILMVRRNRVFIYSNEVWGTIRGIETLSQLQWSIDKIHNSYFMNQTFIIDKPRFPHRGLLLDTSRHFISKEIVMKNLDAMSYAKLNVLHLHLVDDQSFSFEPKYNPEFTKGSYFGRFFSNRDLQEIIEYARLRGIRVIPEIDMPDHTKSWSKSHPEIFAKCKNSRNQATGHIGPIDPSKDEAYSMIKNLMSSLDEQFIDEFIHFGGDEVDNSCWNPNTYDATTKYLQQFFNRVQDDLDTVSNGRKRKIFWEEVLENNLNVRNNTIIQLWKSEPYRRDFSHYSKVNLNIIYSSCWYLDQNRDILWTSFYSCDPEYSGGEACMWSEYQNDDTILQRIWPTALATAERLWSPARIKSIEVAGPRYEEQSCRMLYRGIPQGSTNGPSACSKSNGIFSKFINKNGKIIFQPSQKSSNSFILYERRCQLNSMTLIIFITITIVIFVSLLYTKQTHLHTRIPFTIFPGIKFSVTLKFFLLIVYISFSIFILLSH